QVFNLPPQPPGLFLLWMTAGIATAWIWNSPAAALAALALGMAWMIETWGTGSGHDFGFLAACALLAGLIVRRGWVWAGQFLWL
ncbi:hypothetical protein ABTM35_20025, partial [Acinetobacter baumannii]